jgi:glycosyltransferase involved in cell wall biosynthesis
MKTLKIYYYASKYISLARDATLYKELLQGRCELVANPYEADILILHDSPDNPELKGLANRYRHGKKPYVIGYFVWETDELPESYRTSVSFVHEVWTASRYCHQIFRKYHDRVVYVPHVIDRDITCSDEDRAFVKAAISYDSSYIYFLTITKVFDVRKNVRALVNAFLNVSDNMKRARLIVKARAHDPPYCVDGAPIVYWRQDITDAQINALYELSNVYVSAHHSEGWGMPLADAMIFGKPVIATGYSGNLDFMSDENSFLVNFKEDYVSPQDCNNFFKANMKWAHPDQADLEAKLMLVYKNVNEELVARKVQRASEDIKRFDRSTVGIMIQKRLDELTILLKHV